MKTNKLAGKMIGNFARDFGHNVKTYPNQIEVSVKNKFGLISTFVVRMIDNNVVRIGKNSITVNTLSDLEKLLKFVKTEFKKLV